MPTEPRQTGDSAYQDNRLRLDSENQDMRGSTELLIQGPGITDVNFGMGIEGLTGSERLRVSHGAVAGAADRRVSTIEGAVVDSVTIGDCGDIGVRANGSTVSNSHISGCSRGCGRVLSRERVQGGVVAR